MPVPHASQALSRFTILDLTRVRAGPTCVRQLADWGANVIKIEMPPAIDEGEPLGGPRDGPDFQNLHRNKRSLTLNLKSPEGIAALKRLVERADVLVENFRPDVKDRLGIDYETMRKVNPRLVYACISGFGQDGPYAKRPGFDQIAQGMGGLMSITGLPGQGPVRVGIPVADLCAGLFCALGIHDRAAGARGFGRRPVGADLAAAGADLHAGFPGLALAEQGRGRRRRPATTTRPASRPACSRPPTATSTSRPTGGKMWKKLCDTPRHAAVADAPEYATAAARSANRDELNEEIERHTVKTASAEWVDRLNEAGVPCGPIYAIDQVFADPQVEHLGIAQNVVNTRTARRSMWSASRSRCRGRRARSTRAPPKLGEHTDEMLGEFGFSADEIASSAPGECDLSQARLKPCPMPQ